MLRKGLLTLRHARPGPTIAGVALPWGSLWVLQLETLRPIEG